MTIDDKAITKRAMEESIREGVAFPYRLLIIRQHEHETAGRFKEAGECAAVRYCMELEAALRSNDQHEGPEASAACRRSLSMRQLGAED